MAFTIFQAGTSLQMMDSAGTIATLSLPTNVTLSSTVPPRFAIFDRYVVMVNSPTRPLTIDALGNVRVLALTPPATYPTLSAVAGGTLTGTYTVRQTYIVLDSNGNVIAESDYGPASSSQAVSTQYLKVSNIPLSGDTVTASRFYRTATNGTVYYKWIDLTGNTQTSIQDDLADAGLSLVASPLLGNAPYMNLVAEWRGRLWGVSRTKLDYLSYTEAGSMYAWPAANSILIPRLGADKRGITALATRREALGIGRQNSIHQITGTSNTDFRAVKVTENVGIESQESVCVYRDTIYFLWKDGVYSWDNTGIKSLSDGKVRSWFTTDSYFNRARFKYAFGMVDPNRNRYKLFLASAGSSVEDRWVEYDLNDKTWWGPHKTDAFSPTCSFILSDSNDLLLPVIGGSTGFVWKEQSTPTDNVSTGIAINLDTKFFDGNTPDIEKHWGETSILGKVQTAGSIVITPKVGYLDAAAGTPLTYDMTQGRQRLDRLGDGKMVQLNFTHSAPGEPVELYGFEIPYHEIGRR